MPQIKYVGIPRLELVLARRTSEGATTFSPQGAPTPPRTGGTEERQQQKHYTSLASRKKNLTSTTWSFARRRFQAPQPCPEVRYCLILYVAERSPQAWRRPAR